MPAHILVIDDEMLVRDAFCLALEDEGYEIAVAENGEEGIEAAAKRRPDLIFLDLKMPGINGVETMRRLLAADPTLKIYIVTGFAAEFMEDLEAARSKGAKFELAAKPLAGSQIREITNSVLGLD